MTRNNSVFFTSLLLVLSLLSAGRAAANDNLVTLLFNYSGTLNQQAVEGQASLMIDPQTGEFDAAVWFDRLSPTFNPAVAGFSLVSISCSNAAASEGPPNILDTTLGDYTSIRRVRVYDENQSLVGDFEINGRFHKVSAKVFKADVLLTGYYHGPVDLLNPTGYSLPTAPQADGSLRGSTTVQLSTASGRTLRAEHEHTYVFEQGVQQPPVPNVMVVTYAPSSTWNATERVLRLAGTSVIRNP